MELFFRRLGSGDPLIILHGLYGSSDNWYSIGRALAEDHEVFMPDQRNHGNSAHHLQHDYSVMADDLEAFFEAQHLQTAVIIGHSMGGKTALAFGLRNPGMVKKMIVVDISPFRYDESSAPEDISHEHILRSLLTLDPGSLTGREDADNKLKPFISSVPVRQFLLKNLKRDSGGRFYWALNLPALQEHLPDIYDSTLPAEDAATPPEFPLLFIKGASSGYLKKEEFENIRHYFPRAELAVIGGAGHWVHAEQPEEFLSVVRKFLAR
jgi:esterase